MLKTSSQPGWTNGPKGFNCIPQGYQAALKYNIHFPGKGSRVKNPD